MDPVPQAINQKSPTVSPSGKYTAVLSASGEFWTLQITEGDGTKFEETTPFRSQFNLYWIWDEHDQLWFHYSDDGSEHVWYRSETGWQRIRGLKPPEALRPDYAREKK